jgi:hypothetical protein
MRNAINGIDPMRRGRIKVICKVTAKYGDGISYVQLVAGTNSSSSTLVDDHPRFLERDALGMVMAAQERHPR